MKVPYDTDAEAAVIGCALSSATMAMRVAVFLDPDDCYVVAAA